METTTTTTSVVPDGVTLARLYAASTPTDWEHDAEVFGEQAAILFAGQRDAREAFFRAMYDQGSWRAIELTKELTGAAAAADPEARQFTQFVEIVYAHAISQGGCDQRDLPGKNETRLWFWLFRYQQELDTASIPETLMPTKRDHAEALLRVFRDCRTPAERRERIERMAADAATTLNRSSAPTKAFCQKWGEALVIKPGAIPEARVHWRDLDLNPPRQTKAESALDRMQSLERRGNNLPPEVRAAMRAVLAVFRDDRHVLAVVNEEDEIQGLLCRQKLIWGFMEEQRTRAVGGRGKRLPRPLVTAVIANGPDWLWEELRQEQVDWANDYSTLRRYCQAMLTIPPWGRKKAVTEWVPPVFPTQAAAERATELSRLQGLLPGGLRMVAVPLEAVQQLNHEGLVGRNVEAVIDRIPLTVEAEAVAVGA
jgi:hypothetical protein